MGARHNYLKHSLQHFVVSCASFLHDLLLMLYVFQKHTETWSLASQRKNCGRKLKLTPRHLRHIEIAIRRSPTKSSRKLKMEPKNTGVDVGDSTLRRYLKKMGLVSHFAAHKPLLTRRHRTLQEFWRKVLFTDEKHE